MTSTPDETADQAPTPVRRSLRARSRLGGAGIALTDVALIAAPFLFLFWLLASEGGLRALIAGVRWGVPALQQIEVESGSFLSVPKLRAVRYDDGSLRIEVPSATLDWRPLAVLKGRLDISRLTLDELRITTTPGSEPVSVPVSLELPLVVQAKLAVRRLVVADATRPAGGEVVLGNLAMHIDSDGVTHRLSGLALNTPWGNLSGQAALGGARPFALSGDLAFASSDYSAQASLGGSLVRGASIDLRAQGFGLTGAAHAIALPFAAQPLAALKLALDEFDPQRLVASAPAGLWTVRAELLPRAGDLLTLAGPLNAENRASGRLDQNRLPVRALSALLEVSAARVDLRDLLLRLSGDAVVSGEAGWRAGAGLPVRAALAVRGLDAAALHGRGVATKLDGRVDVEASGDRQQFRLDLRDRGPNRIALEAAGAVARQTLVLDSAQVSARGARSTLAGTLKLDDSFAFSVDGALHQFDPSAFARVPGARLSAKFSASGQLQPHIDARAAVDFLPSTVMGEALAGRVRGHLQGQRLSDADVLLDWAGNRLVVQGSFGGVAGGRTGPVQDALTWTLDAQRLGALRALTGLELAGQVSGRGRLAGSIAAPEGSLELDVRALRLGDLGSIARAGLQAELAPGAGGRIHLMLDVADVRSPSAPAPVEQIRVDIDGTRAAHRLTARARLADQPAERGDKPVSQSLDLSAHGSLSENLKWSGLLDQTVLVLSPELTATLGAPAALSASPRGATLENAAFALTAGGELLLAHTSWTPDRIEARGRARGFPMRLTWRDRAAGISARAPLRLGADWSLRASLSGEELIEGRVDVFRQSGNVVVSGEGRVDLVVSEARAQADFSARSADVTARIAGPDIGDAHVSLHLPMHRQGRLWQPSPEEPVSGRATLDIPSLAWIGRALRLDMSTAGRVRADVSLGGRLQAPELTGRIDGDGLAFALADAGLKLERGQLRARFARDRLDLDDLSFESGNLHPPRDARLNAGERAREPGRLTAAGGVELSSGLADIAIRFHRFVPLQGGDQWLMVSGDGTVRGSASTGMTLQLALVADGGLFSVPEQSPPALGDDVVIKGRGTDESGGPPLAMRIDVDLGERFFFRGRGLDTRLAGRIALRDEGRGVHATGNIQAVNGRYRAYGQNLDIERGVVSFQGSLANPGLNVRAIRPDLPVQAGVEVTGTVQRPRVRLVSDTAMPDSEKLSWIVLGRGQDSAAGADLSLLATAAGAFLTGEGEGVTASLAQALGLEQISLTQTATASGPRSQVVVSQNSTTTVSGQVVSVGKRLSSNALLTYEQGVAGATSVVKLTWNLTRRLALIGSTGTEQAVDVRYVFSFK